MEIKQYTTKITPEIGEKFKIDNSPVFTCTAKEKKQRCDFCSFEDLNESFNKEYQGICRIMNCEAKTRPDNENVYFIEV